jgi:D-alanyl-lipoteichoic acid acyltransferase DltB (MBOAT superfamily)
MLFHTWVFFLFFLIFYIVYLGLRTTRFMNLWLLIASYIFYAWWNPLYLLLIVFSTAVDYSVVLLMDRSGRKKLWLLVSIVTNLGLLGFFKYAGFLTENLNALLLELGTQYRIRAPDVLLPVGISFYTFQSMSYTIDAYRGILKPEHSFIRFASFVSLFPQLVAGPIERAKNLLPQLCRVPVITREDISEGLSLFLVGLFKKVAMADYLALYVDQIYDTPGEHSSPALILATFAFGWQIYFDFSGYTDMARGIARLMGFRLMLNFNNPYVATGLGDFWSRWHISLSTWFKDYVYIPLGGNRGGKFNTYKNMFFTMVVSGLWHGAAWTFIIWGALHALGRFFTRELERTNLYRERVPKLVKQLLVFSFVTFTWIFFRAQGLDEALLIVKRIFTSGWEDPRFPPLMLALILSIWIYQFLHSSGGEARRVLELRPVRVGAVIFMILYLATVARPSSEPFIYFQF